MMRSGSWLVFFAVLMLAAQMTSATVRPFQVVPSWWASAPQAALDLGTDAGLEDLAQGALRGVWRGLWQMLSVIYHAVQVWGRWLTRGMGFVAIAAVIGFLDRHLLAAWRQDGLRVLGNYVPMMFYVYVRLFFDPRVLMMTKMLLVAGIVYGVSSYDLIPDETIIPGYAEDVLFIAVAMRVFLYYSPKPVVEEYASQAVSFRRRVLALTAIRNRSS